MKDRVINLIFDEYSVEPEYPWKDTPDACVFRHYNNRKWFAIIMTVRNKCLGLDGDGYKDVINVKINPADIYDLLAVDGILPAYHMNKKHWVTVLLDGTISIMPIKKLLAYSFDVTK